MEELDVRDRPAIHLLEDLRRLRPLDLVAVMRAQHPLALGARRRTRVVLDAHVPLAVGGAEQQPVRGRRAADEDELVHTLAEDDVIADDVAVRRHGHEVLGAVEAEIRERIDAVIGEELLGLGTFDDQLVHVMGLVEEHCGIAPGALLLTPVGKLRRDDRVYIHADFGVAKHLHRIAFFLQHGFQTGFCHFLSSRMGSLMYTISLMRATNASAICRRAL